MKLIEIISLKKKEKDILINISTILGITAVLMTTIMILYQFAIYIYDIQWFNYWSIDSTFYEKNSTEVINGLLFGFAILCLCIFFSLAMYGISKKNDKTPDKKKTSKIKDLLTFLAIYTFTYFLIGLKDLYYYDFSGERIFIHVIGIIFSLLLITYYTNKVLKLLERKDDVNPLKKTIKDLLIDLLAIIIAVFISMMMLGNINSIFKNNYKIITNNDQCNVILYSSSEYYIIAKCDIDEKNAMTVYKKSQIKIDNYNVEYRLKEFTRVTKNNK